MRRDTIRVRMASKWQKGRLMLIKEKYAVFIHQNQSRLLTHIDRDPHSPTYGCCDRDFWHYRIRDFPSAILQQSGLFCAYAYLNNFNGNALFKNSATADLSKAVLRYWTKIQLKDGSFNEYYPYEHGFPPTAFSFYAACETYRLLGLDDTDLLAHLARTARFLLGKDETQASNQQTASITALYSYYLISGEAAVQSGVERKLTALLKVQSSEGWFPEYGGADFGYQSVGLDMLAEYFHLSQDERVLEPLDRTARFLADFAHPDGTIGGQYGSRNTTYFLPCGVELLAAMGNADARYLREKVFKACDQPGYFQHAIDDRYMAHYVLHSFLRAYAYPCVCDGANSVAERKPETRFLPESGLLSVQKDAYHAVCSLKKGGIIRISSRQGGILADYGYRILLGRQSIATTAWLDMGYRVMFDPARMYAQVSGHFNRIKLRSSNPLLHAGLRVLSFIFGSRLIKVLKGLLIFGNKHTSAEFTRKIKFYEASVEVEDEIESPTAVWLTSAPPFSLRHVASSKFFTNEDLHWQPRFEARLAQSLRCRMVFNIQTNQVDVKILE